MFLRTIGYLKAVAGVRLLLAVICPLQQVWRLAVSDLKRHSASFGRASGAQRKEPVDIDDVYSRYPPSGDVRFGHLRWPERQLYKVQLPICCGRPNIVLTNSASGCVPID